MLYCISKRAWSSFDLITGYIIYIPFQSNCSTALLQHKLTYFGKVKVCKKYKMNETIPIMSYGTELCQFANADCK